ncbi:MAG: exodeoxyribonuclease III [Acidimicrobiia bacterium]|nr:exodeoxyribonuclease III [Acidimicrobiia bacterium]
MRVITYNVNSLRARLPRLMVLLEEHRPDVVCLQETKSTTEQFPHDALEAAGYAAVDHSGGRWEGVAVLARQELPVTGTVLGLEGEAQPDQARWIEAIVSGVRVVSVYVPNGQAIGSAAFLDKLAFLDAMSDRAAALAHEPVIICGDMNVCPSDLDVWSVPDIHGGTHITPEERERLAKVVDRGYVDAYRSMYPDEPGFTWWDYRAGHFHKGFGLRIDHALLSPGFSTEVERVWVDRSFRKPSKVREAKPSDHAPLVIDLTYELKAS